MRKILTDAAAVGNAAGRALNWRPAESLAWSYYPGSMWTNMLWQGGYNFETPPPMITKDGFKPLPPAGARTLNSRAAFYYGYTMDSPGMIMRVPNVGSQYLIGFMDADKIILMVTRITRSPCLQTFQRANSGRSPCTTIRLAPCFRHRSASRAQEARRTPRRPPSRSRTAQPQSIPVHPSQPTQRTATGSRQRPGEAGSRFCASTARSHRSSTKLGA
jgi:hypothetical protein